MKPWQVEGSPWKTESAFWSWVRGQLRRSWNRHPVKHLYLQSKRYKKKNEKGRETWHVDCENCLQTFKQAATQVDHIEPSGSFKRDEDIERFVKRLYFVTFEDLQILCKECHLDKTYYERYGKPRPNSRRNEKDS